MCMYMRAFGQCDRVWITAFGHACIECLCVMYNLLFISLPIFELFYKWRPNMDWQVHSKPRRPGIDDI